MSITDAGRDIPDELRTAEFWLRPITADDAERDHAALMDTREALRLWQQSTWPEDDFTVEANREDLVGMAQRRLEHRAFDYTVLDPDGVECRGCVYVFPPTAAFLTRATVTALGDDAWDDVEAVVFFWVRRPFTESGADARLLAGLRAWFRDEWHLATTVYATSATFTQQVELLERAGLQRRFEVHESDHPAPRLVFG